MRRNVRTILLLFAAVILLCSCGKSKVPSRVSEYAEKHRISCYTPSEAVSKCNVGEECVVYGKVTRIYFWDYIDGSEDLINAVSSVPENVQGFIYDTYVDNMRYSIVLDNCDRCDLSFEHFSSEYYRLGINVGDTVAFVTTCTDNIVTPGEYEYVISEKVWESRTSTTTVEEDHDASIGR